MFTALQYMFDAGDVLPRPKVSVSNIKNTEFRNIFKGIDPFEFLNLKPVRIADLATSTASDAMPHRTL